MNKKILIGSIIASLILVLVSIGPSINAEAEIIKVEPQQEDNATPIVLVLQLITKLRNHNEIKELEENIDSVENVENEVMRIIEGDEELNSIVEQLSVEDCGCEDDIKWDRIWPFPVICFLLFPFVLFATILFLYEHLTLPLQIMGTIGKILNCVWYI